MERKELEYHTLLCNNGQKIKLAVPIRLPEQMKCSVDDAWATVFVKEMNALAYALWMARAERARCERVSLKIYAHNANWVKWEWVESKCREYAQKFKETSNE